MKKEKDITLACVPVCYDENGSDVAYAMVTLSEKYIEMLLARISLAKGLSNLIGHFFCLEEFDYSVEYIRYGDPPYEALKDVGDEWKILPDVKTMHFKDSSIYATGVLVGESVRIDVPTLVVMNKSVHWTACIKHTNVKLATAHLDEEYLAKMIKQLGGKV